MYEVELKARIENRLQCEQRLRALGGTKIRVTSQQDEYFNHPCRDFAQTDEAFRIRRYDSAYRVTYKGPKLGGDTKTRREIEFPLPPESAEGFRACLLELGFRPVATVRKTRTIWHVRYSDVDFEVAFDEVDQLGSFIELEVDAPDTSLEHAQQTTLALARELDLGPSITRSYLEMLLEQSGGETSGAPGG